MNFARVFGAQPALPAAHIVTVETDMTKGLHAFTKVGTQKGMLTDTGRGFSISKRLYSYRD